jgi:signal transduction histidine kinase
LISAPPLAKIKVLLPPTGRWFISGSEDQARAGVALTGHSVGTAPDRGLGGTRLSIPRFDSRRSYAGQGALLVLAYYAAAHLGYAFRFSGPVASIVWLPVGVGIAGLYLFGLRLWPAVVIGDLLVNNYSALPVGAAVSQSFGNLLEVVIGAVLLRRFVSRGAPLDTATGVAGVFAALTVATAISAIIGPLSLALHNVIPARSIWRVARTWWLGDFCGAAIVLPLVLAFSAPSSHRWLRGHVAEACVLFATLIGLSTVAAQVGGPSSYLAFPVLIWAGFRFGPRGATVAIAISAAFTMWGATDFSGGFMVNGSDSIPSTQIYVAVAALATLAVAALASEREQLARSVRASRTRIVLAADDERRRLERNLHDGAQGRLVALAARLGLAAQAARRAPETAAGSFETAHDELLVAIDELRELVQGIQPAALRQFGLATAVEDVAARSVTPIELVGLPRVRLDETTEATAFYLIREAVTNAERYARASVVHVRAHLSPASLTVEVQDDGVGGAFERNDRGLQGLRDRVEATGGRFELDSEPGAGTRIKAEIPRNVMR